MEQKKHSAKLLLFGEFSVVLGGEALAIPFDKYGGQLSFLSKQSSSVQQEFHLQLTQFAIWLRQTDFPIQHKKLESDLENGIFFDSDIPQGYGAGSSGAFCAAIFDHYALEKPIAIAELRAIFARMEGYFHGNSSGVDPLISYLDKGLHLQGKDKFQPVDVSLEFLKKAGFFLLNTQIPRKTQPLVDHFLERCKDSAYQDACKNELGLFNKNAIQATLMEDAKLLKESFRAISAFQWTYFQRMIPSTYRELWENGLNTYKYALKICGAGGGGFLYGLKFEEDDLLEKQRIITF